MYPNAIVSGWQMGEKLQSQSRDTLATLAPFRPCRLSSSTASEVHAVRRKFSEAIPFTTSQRLPQCRDSLKSQQMTDWVAKVSQGADAEVLRSIPSLTFAPLLYPVRVKCSPDDTVGDLKKLIAAQTGTDHTKIQLKKWCVLMQQLIFDDT